jgi:hypothetical protein
MGAANAPALRRSRATAAIEKRMVVKKGKANEKDEGM